MARPLVSIIIPTKDSETTIETCLDSIRAQTYPKVEIIIVDKFSTDKTRMIAERYGIKVIMANAIRSRARNIGAIESKGDFIFSIDSDMELTPNVIKECVKRAAEWYDAVIIPEISVGKGFWVACRALERSCYIGDDTLEAARFFRKEVFEKAGGYDPQLEYGEDWDFNQRLRNAGFKIARINASIIHHEGRLNLWNVIRKKYRYGKSLDRYVQRHEEMAKKQLVFLRPALLRNWKKLIRDPVHAIGMMIMRTCEFGAAGIGLIKTRLFQGKEN
jgi:glycosyltransferase involved in cell wall biosynthesis